MRLTEIISRGFRFHELVYVSITQKCPLRCRHCFVESAPERTEHVETSDFSLWMEGMVQTPSVKAILFSGGEPFSNPGALKIGLTKCHDAGKQAIVGTSAFWATTKEQAGKFLDRYAGIDTLFISYDVFHEEFVSVESIRFAVEAAEERGIDVSFQIVEEWGTATEFTERFMATVDPENRRAGDVYIVPLGLKGRAATDLNILANAGPHAGEGRHTMMSVQDTVCPWLGAPWVHEDGIVCACPNLEVHKAEDSPLQLGSLQTATFEEVSSRAHADLLVQGLRSLGPKVLAELIGGSHLDVHADGTPTICDLCHLLTQDKTAVATIRDVLSRPVWQRRMGVSRLLAYGEY